jgi:hypothetical protein
MGCQDVAVAALCLCAGYTIDRLIRLNQKMVQLETYLTVVEIFDIPI